MAPTRPEKESKASFEAIPVTEEALTDYLLAIGRTHARQEGANDFEADDCAITFVEELLINQQLLQATNRARWTATGIHVCARNHAKDFLRKERVHHIHDLEAVGALAVANESPEEVFAREQFYERLLFVLDELPANQRDLIMRHYLDGETATEIAI